MPLILGLESSCDDSAVALVGSDRRILAHAVVSQNAAHRPYGGVVPEIAARAHVEILPPLIRRVLAEAGIAVDEVDDVAIADLAEAGERRDTRGQDDVADDLRLLAAHHVRPLALPRRARRGRDRQLELGHALEQRPDERSLADPGGSGEHGDLLVGDRPGGALGPHRPPGEGGDEHEDGRAGQNAATGEPGQRTAQPRGVQLAWNWPASARVISLFWTRSEASPRAARLASITQTSMSRTGSRSGSSQFAPQAVMYHA